MIYFPEHSVPTKILVDSGTDESFIDSDFVNTHCIPTYDLTVLKEDRQVLSTLSRWVLLTLVTRKTQPPQVHRDVCHLHSPELHHPGHSIGDS